MNFSVFSPYAIVSESLVNNCKIRIIEYIYFDLNWTKNIFVEFVACYSQYLIKNIKYLETLGLEKC